MKQVDFSKESYYYEYDDEDVVLPTGHRDGFDYSLFREFNNDRERMSDE